MRTLVRVALAAAIGVGAPVADSYADDQGVVGQDELEAIRNAAGNRDSVVAAGDRAQHFVALVNTGRSQTGKPTLTPSEADEVRRIVDRLEQARVQAWRVFAAGDQTIRDEIILLDQQLAAQAEGRRRKARQEAIANGVLSIMKGISDVASVYKAAEAQARVQELQGGAIDARADASRTLASQDDGEFEDFVSDGAGYSIDELFDPLAANPAIQHLSELNDITGQCWDRGMSWLDNAFPSWEGRLPYSDGADAAKSAAVMRIFWDCSVQGRDPTAPSTFLAELSPNPDKTERCRWTPGGPQRVEVVVVGFVLDLPVRFLLVVPAVLKVRVAVDRVDEKQEAVNRRLRLRPDRHDPVDPGAGHAAAESKRSRCRSGAPSPANSNAWRLAASSPRSPR